MFVLASLLLCSLPSILLVNAATPVVQDSYISPPPVSGISFVLTEGDNFTLRWKDTLASWWIYYAPSGDPRNCTLILTDAKDLGFNAVLARNFDTVANLEYPWVVGTGMSPSWIAAAGLEWIFRFTPSNLTYVDGRSQQISSPHFNISLRSSTLSKTTISATSSVSVPPTSAISLTTTLSATSSPTGAAANTGSSSSSTSTSGGLSSGAIAGIAVGAVIGGLAVIGLLFFLYRRHLKQKNAAEMAKYQGGNQWGGGQVYADAGTPQPPPSDRATYGGYYAASSVGPMSSVSANAKYDPTIVEPQELGATAQNQPPAELSGGEMVTHESKPLMNDNTHSHPEVVRYEPYSRKS